MPAGRSAGRSRPSPCPVDGCGRATLRPSRSPSPYHRAVMGTNNSAGQRLRAKWKAGEPAFGLWAGIPTSLTAELGATAGYDYVCVDLQHGLSDEATMVAMFQATQLGGAVPMARLAWNEPWLIMRALDLGAVGVVLPLIDNAVEARRAVDACRYAPRW